MNPTADTQTATTWPIDPAHTQVGFVVKHMMFAKVRGAFNEFDGSIVQGDGWALTLAPDWTLEPADRRGDYRLARR